MIYTCKLCKKCNLCSICSGTHIGDGVGDGICRWARARRGELVRHSRVCREGYEGGSVQVAGLSCLTPGQKASGVHAFKFEARDSGCPDGSGVPRHVGGPALNAGRPGVTLGARSDGHVGGPALVARRSCVTPGAYSCERSRPQAPGQRQLDCCPRRQDETRYCSRQVGQLGVWQGRSSHAARIIR